MIIVPAFIIALFTMTLLIMVIIYLLAVNCVLFAREFPTLTTYIIFVSTLKLVSKLMFTHLNRPKRKPHDPNELCSICLCAQTNHVLHCNHWFHQQCIDQWAQKTSRCPMCRAMM
jgi:hypothetical protein